MNLTITPTAAKYIAHHGDCLRIRIKSGGCAGLRTLFTFEKAAQEDDIVISSAGASVVVDPLSFSFIKGATLDYKEEMMVSQFVLTHPDASNKCGCGESFSLS
jgi:iron-sulfur cluster insertion protein